MERSIPFLTLVKQVHAENSLNEKIRNLYLPLEIKKITSNWNLKI